MNMLTLFISEFVSFFWLFDFSYTVLRNVDNELDYNYIPSSDKGNWGSEHSVCSFPSTEVPIL